MEGGKAGVEHQNSIIWAFFHKLFHSCSNAVEQTLAEEETQKSSCQMKLLVTVSAELLIKTRAKNEGRPETKARIGNEAIFTLSPSSFWTPINTAIRLQLDMCNTTANLIKTHPECSSIIQSWDWAVWQKNRHSYQVFTSLSNTYKGKITFGVHPNTPNPKCGYL